MLVTYEYLYFNSSALNDCDKEANISFSRGKIVGYHAYTYVYAGTAYVADKEKQEKCGGRLGLFDLV